MTLAALLVCEGPMDCLTACSFGYPAVATPSASTWKSDYAAGVTDLAPREVVVAGDCDPAGRQRAEKASADLAGHGLCVRVLDLDADRADKYDLGDFLLAGRRLP